MPCGTCQKFTPFPNQTDPDCPIYGLCGRNRQAYCETDICYYKGYYYRKVKRALETIQRRFASIHRRIMFWLRWRIYYKVEHLWIRPQMCCVCGQKMGVHYYGAHTFPIEWQGHYESVKGLSHTVRWKGKRRKVAHWECDECFQRLNTGAIIPPNATACGIGIAGFTPF